MMCGARHHAQQMGMPEQNVLHSHLTRGVNETSALKGDMPVGDASAEGDIRAGVMPGVRAAGQEPSHSAGMSMV